MTDELKSGTPEAKKLLDEFDELAKKKGTIVQGLEVSGDSGGSVLRGMLPMLEMIASSAPEGEDRDNWWRSFCVEAHLLCLEHVGMEEAGESLMYCARIIAERVASQSTRTQ